MRSKHDIVAEEEGLKPLKTKKQPRIVRSKKHGIRLKSWTSRRKTKAVALLSAALVMGIGGFAVGSIFMQEASLNNVDLSYGSVVHAVEEGELFTPEANYTGIDIFARLNWKFSQQEHWYGEMHGVVDTVIQQKIETYKQYNEGVLISADLTSSSIVSAASQFCYMKDLDRVIWRKPAGGSSTYDGLNTVWKDEVYRDMEIGGADGFKAKNGLPAYELSVYVIEENTVQSCSDVVALDNGMYTIRYDLKPETWEETTEGGTITKGATAYYANQMIFTGGLPEAPVFDSISVSFTFDENWQVFATDIEESYSAKYGPIAAPCTSTSHTEYEYNTERSYSPAYDEFFREAAEAPIMQGPVEEELTVVDCLAEAFGGVLTGPVVFDLGLTVNGTPVSGEVYLDITTMDVRARIGNVYVWYAGDEVYLDLDGVKAKAGVEGLMELVGGLTAGEGEGISLDTEALLGQLAGGEFTVTDTNAVLTSELELFGIRIPLQFQFVLAEDGSVSLGKVSAQLSVAGVDLGAELAFGDEGPAPLTEEEKAVFIDLVPYAGELIDLFTSGELAVQFSYENGTLALGGELEIALDPFALRGFAEVSVQGVGSKRVDLAFTDGAIYLDLDGVKVMAETADALALIQRFIALPELDADVDASALVNRALDALFTPGFADNFVLSEDGARLSLLLHGTELLKALGIDFEAGEVELTVGDGLHAKALGAEIDVTKGEPFVCDTNGYTAILPSVEKVIDLLEAENLSVKANYESEKLQVYADLGVQLDLEELSSTRVGGTVTLVYGKAEKSIGVSFEQGIVYLDLDGIKVKAGAQEAISLVTELMSVPKEDDASQDILAQVFGLNFGKLVTLKEADGALTLAVAGTELLEAFGVKFALGEVDVTIGDTIAASAYGVTLEIAKGEPFVCDTNGYTDILPYAESLIDLFGEGYLHAELDYHTGDLAVQGVLLLDLNDIAVSGTVDLTYKTVSKQVRLALEKGVVYLDLDGIKVQAGVDEIVTLVEQFIKIPESDSNAQSLLERLFSLDFGAVVSVGAADGTLSVSVKGTELLKALGLDFEAGEVELTVGDGLHAKALGAEIDVTKGEPFVCDTNGYTAILPSVEKVIDLLEAENLSVKANYESEKLQVYADLGVQLDLEELSSTRVGGTVTLVYGKAEKSIGVSFEQGIVYLDLDGIKVKAGAQEAISLVTELMSVPKEDDASQDILAQVFGLNFGKLVTLKEADGALTLAVAGTELLEAFGVKFALGEVDVTIGDTIAASAYGVTLEIAKGEPFVCDTNGYTAILPSVEKVIDLLEAENLSVKANYESEKLQVRADLGVQLDLEELSSTRVGGTVTLVYGKAEKSIGVSFEQGIVYLDLDGIKVKAGAQEAISLVTELLNVPKEDNASQDILAQVFGLDFGKLVTLKEADGALALAVAGTELLEAFGLEFALGEVDVTIGDTIAASAYGVTLEIAKGEPFVCDTNGYTDILPYAESLIDLFGEGYLRAELDYHTGDLAVQGVLLLDLNDIAVSGTVDLTYKTVHKTISFVYSEKKVYLTVDTLKLKANVEDVTGLVSSLLTDEEPGEEETDLLTSVLALRFGDLVALEDGAGNLRVTVMGAKLLNALLPDFVKEGKDANVTLDVNAGGITAEAFGVSLRIVKGSAPDLDIAAEEYADLRPLLARVPAIVRDEQIVLTKGDIEVNIGKTTVQLEIRKGYLSWKEGFSLSLDATLCAGGTVHDILIAYDGAKVRFAYGEVGAEIVPAELSSLDEAFVALYNRIYALVGEIADGAEMLPAIKSAKDLLGLMKGGQALTESADAFGLSSLLGGISFAPSEKKDGLLAVKLGVFTADLIASDGGLALALDLTTTVGEPDGTVINLYGEIGADAYAGELPAFPADIALLGQEDLKDLLDYAGAAVGLLGAQNLSLTFGGTVKAATYLDAEGAQQEYPEGVRYNFEGSVRYNAGAAAEGDLLPFHLDPATKNFYVDPDIYVALAFSLAPTVPSVDSALYLELVAVNSDLSGEQDNYLDFYVTVSTVGKGNEGYQPLRIYVPADELLTVLAGVVDMFGVEWEVVNDYFVTPWLSQLTTRTGEEKDEMVARLKAVGEAVLALLDMDVPDLGGDAQSEEQTEAAGSSEEKEAGRRGAVRSFAFTHDSVTDEATGQTTVTGGTFKLALDGGMLFGEGAEDLTVSLSKKTIGGVSMLTGLSVQGVSLDGGTLGLTLGIDSETLVQNDWSVPAIYPAEDGYFDVQGVEMLILSLAKSITHGVDAQGARTGEIISGEQAAHRYVLNDNFYIDGNASLNLHLGDWNLEKITIKVLAVSITIDEDGRVGINARLEYDGVHNTLGGLLGDADIIKGDTTLDLTIKESPRKDEGMLLYMKRTQITHFNGSKEENLPAPEVVYRMLPLDNFMKDYMNTLCFAFNLSETVMGEIMGKVGSSSGSGTGSEAGPQDLGALFRKFVNSCGYELTGSDLANNTWKLVLNGAGITGSSSFDAINVILKTDQDGYLDSIGADLSIAGVVDIAADLFYRNPNGVMDTGTNDKTDKTISEELEGGMAKRLKTVDWTATSYLEGQLLTVTYQLERDNEFVAKQSIVRDSQTGELYADLVYPDEELAQKPVGDGYLWVWEKPTEPISKDTVIYARERGRQYHIVITSEYEIEGYEEEDGMWTYSFDYVYGSGDRELHIGARDITKTHVKELVGFRDIDGNVYSSLTDEWHRFKDQTIAVTAVWQDVVFTVTFEVNGVRSTDSGICGETIDYPETNVKEGYTFRDWGTDAAPATFSAETEDLFLTAQYDANQYPVTLVSEYAIEWEGGSFELQEGGEYDGKYVLRTTLTYDVAFPLPDNYKNEQIGKVLRGFRRVNDKNLYAFALPNVLTETVFTAEWEEVGVDVRFVVKEENGGESVVGTSNLHVGESIESFPAVPSRNGYTGRWNLEPNEEGKYLVTGPMTIEAVYTPITYVIYEYSRFEVTGFKQILQEFDYDGVTGKAYYMRKLLYVYDSGKLILEDGSNVVPGEGVETPGYEFDGFYTARLGDGEPVDIQRPVKELFNSLVADVFRFNVGDGEGEGLEGKNVLYAHWIDKTVTVRLFSELSFASEQGSVSGKGNYCDRTFYDKYVLDFVPTLKNATAGYRFLGWFYNASQGGADADWRLVEDVEQFRDKDAGKTYDAELYALWISEIDVKVTEVYKDGGSLHHINGSVTGGEPAGGKSKDIYTSLGVQRVLQGVYVGVTDGTKDTFKSGKLQEINDSGKFESGGMTSAKFVVKGALDYGGMVVQATFTYSQGGAEKKLYMVDGSVVSGNTYTVRYFTKPNGEQVGEVANVRVPYTGTFTQSDLKNIDFSTVPNHVLVLDSSSATYTDDLAKANGIEAPQLREGYTAFWAHTAVMGDMNVYPSYGGDLQEVVFRSAYRFSASWEEERGEDGQPTGFWLYHTTMRAGSYVQFLANGVSFAPAEEVPVGGVIINIPAAAEIPKVGGVREGHWDKSSVDIGEYGTVFRAVYDADRIFYLSAQRYTLDGESYEANVEYAVEFESELTLPTPSMEGYTFLGWYKKVGDGSNVSWERVEKLTLAATYTETHVEALWMLDLSVEIKSVDKHYNYDWDRTYTHKIDAEVTGGTFIGGPAAEGSVRVHYRYYVNNNTNDEPNTSDVEYDRVGTDAYADSCTIKKAGNKTHGHVAVYVVFTCGDNITHTSETVYACKAF